MDFSESIKALEVRAKKCRRTMLIIGTAIVLTTQVMVMLIFYQYQGSEIEFKFKNQTIESALKERGNKLVSGIISTDANTTGMEEERLKTTIELLNSLGKSKGENTSQQSGFAGSLSTFAFSFGAVALMILIIQISVQFMRYYARLAELYNTQADALRVSNGDAEVAFKFMEHFSPANVELGKAPSTVYEKALETISNVAKK